MVGGAGGQHDEVWAVAEGETAVRRGSRQPPATGGGGGSGRGEAEVEAGGWWSYPVVLHPYIVKHHYLLPDNTNSLLNTVVKQKSDPCQNLVQTHITY